MHELSQLNAVCKWIQNMVWMVWNAAIVYDIGEQVIMLKLWMNCAKWLNYRQCDIDVS